MRLLLPLLLLLSACQAPSPTTKLAIVGARLVDGKGGSPIEHSIVLIEGATIVKTGPQSSVPLPKDAEVIDGMNQTIEPIPGGRPIEAGNPASLTLSSNRSARTMKDGQWLK